MSYAFGEFTYDVDEQQLHRQGEDVHLEPKAMQLLEILIARRPNVVKHQDLYDAIWPDVVVLEANLGNLVSDLRNALDDHDRKLIRTAHGRGYSFRGDVIETDAGSPSRQVVLRYGRRRFDLEPGENIIGRGPDADVRINDTEISRRHARVVIEPNRVTIQDLASKNGTIVNGDPIEGQIPIDDGDELLLGTITLTVTVVLANGGYEDVASKVRLSTNPTLTGLGYPVGAAARREQRVPEARWRVAGGEARSAEPPVGIARESCAPRRGDGSSRAPSGRNVLLGNRDPVAPLRGTTGYHPACLRHAKRSSPSSLDTRREPPTSADLLSRSVVT